VIHTLSGGGANANAEPCCILYVPGFNLQALLPAVYNLIDASLHTAANALYII